MRVVVTGGAGYIGSVVTEQLTARGHDVLVLDNLSRGHRDAVAAPACFARIDLIDRDAVAEALTGFRAEAVVHMAASSLVGESVADPAAYYRNNVAAGVALLDAMRDASVERLVFSSTAAVYGEPERQPIQETDSTAPTNPYGETKLALERALRWYAHAYGLSSTSLRYFNAAGASTDAKIGERREIETHLVPNALKVVNGEKKELLIFGDDYPTPDGTCIRDYIHVEDLCEAHLLALKALRKGTKRNAFNLGTGRGHSVKEVVAMVEKVTGKKVKTRIVKRREGDTPNLVAGPQKARRVLGWKVRKDLKEIVETAWQWEKSK